MARQFHCFKNPACVHEALKTIQQSSYVCQPTKSLHQLYEAPIGTIITKLKMHKLGPRWMYAFLKVT